MLCHSFCGRTVSRGHGGTMSSSQGLGKVGYLSVGGPVPGTGTIFTQSKAVHHLERNDDQVILESGPEITRSRVRDTGPAAHWLRIAQFIFCFPASVLFLLFTTARHLCTTKLPY